MDFTDGTAVVTGAASGAGKATAIAFGNTGANVALLDINEDGAREVAELIEASGTKAMVCPVDLARSSDVQAALRAVHERFGRLDAVANVAGIYPKATVPEVTEEFWDRMLAVDLRAVFFCCQEAIRIMSAQGHGAIVNVASDAAWRPLVGHATYSAAKAGLVGMSRVLALECARTGVRVNVVAPGHISGGQSVETMSELQRQGLAIATAVARAVTPEEIANTILWLCSDAASGVNGGIIHVNMGNFTAV